MKPTVSIIVPFVNEAENIPFLVDSLGEFLDGARASFDGEVIFVNDGSTDESISTLINSFERCPHRYAARLVSLSKNFGSHAALRAGIVQAKGDYVSFLYADLQDPPSLITQMFSECMKGVDITWAVRSGTQNGLFERLFSSFYSQMMRRYVSPSYPEKGFDVVMFSRKVRDNMNRTIEANSSVFLQILTFGYKQRTIEYAKHPRKKGKSKWTFGKKVKLFVDSFVAFSYAPIRFVTLMGFSMFFVGLVWTSYLVIRKLLVGDLETGWPALVSLLFIGFGVTNISLGIIAEYLWRTLDASRNRPVFIIDEVVDLAAGKAEGLPAADVLASSVVR